MKNNPNIQRAELLVLLALRIAVEIPVMAARKLEDLIVHRHVQ